MRHYDVLRLDVQVQNAARVEVVQTLEDLHDVRHHVILRVTEPGGNQRTFRPITPNSGVKLTLIFQILNISQVYDQMF